jgi:hypothetical protein
MSVKQKARGRNRLRPQILSISGKTQKAAKSLDHTLDENNFN